MRELVFFAILFFTNTLLSQERCGFYVPVESSDVFEQWMDVKLDQKLKLSKTQDVAAVVYRIPVVVHVIHNGEGLGTGLNLPDSRINEQITVLNEDFRRKNSDASDTPGRFRSVAADSEIEFVLAKQDPLGNPTNGIVRIHGFKTRFVLTNDKDLLRTLSFWPPQHYLNIVVTSSSSLGSASFPVTTLAGIKTENDDLIFDGVIIDYEYFGNNTSTPSFDSYGRTTTHEIGHYLGLRHIWGDGKCSADDFVSDTPLADTNNSGLGSPCTFPNPDDNNVCASGDDEMFMNYMDYTNDVCMNLFTVGQKNRMRTVLENSPRRTTLRTSPGLSEPTRFANDLAIKQIRSPNPATCNGIITPSVEIVNYGTNTVTSYDITATLDGSSQLINRSTSLASLASEIITFSSSEIDSAPSSINFLVTNVNGGSDQHNANNSITQSITALASSGITFKENFEGTIKLLGNMGSTFPWQQVTAFKDVASNQALSFKSYDNTKWFGESTVIKTPVFNFSGLQSIEMTFSYAYAQQTSSDFHDGLVVKVSTDCGQTFSSNLLFNKYGTDLVTARSTAGSFAPTSSGDWEQAIISLTQFAGMDGVQLAFIGQNGAGNNIYLDDIFITPTDLYAHDVSLVEFEAPIVTCDEMTSVSLEVRNIGLETINSLMLQYTVDGFNINISKNNLSIPSGNFRTLTFDLPALNNLQDEITISVASVNGQPDASSTNNTVVYATKRNNSTDTYPLLVDFETSNLWVTETRDNIQLWCEKNLSGNDVLVAEAYNQPNLVLQSWFISPVLSVGTLDSAGLSFKVSHAERAGFSDRLQVLMSVNCGSSYSMKLFDAYSDLLAVTQNDSEWTPNSESDWKEFKVDLKPSIIWSGSIRLAFVFTGGNGNNLFLDDINIGIKPSLQNENTFRLFPNPAKSRFSMAVDIQPRDDVTMEIMDISGRIILKRSLSNALDQVYNFDAPAQNGFYFVKLIGRNINRIERLYIQR